MKTFLPVSITTIDEAKALLRGLHDNGETFHPDDDATDISIFTQGEGVRLNKLMAEIYNLGFDPCGYLIEMDQVRHADDSKHIEALHAAFAHFYAKVDEWQNNNPCDDLPPILQTIATACDHLVNTYSILEDALQNGSAQPQ